MRILHLYRPTLPGLRAQAIQIAHTCHALAARGHQVTLLADRAHAGASVADALGALGLDHPTGLDLRLAPSPHKGVAGAWFRGAAAAWLSGAPGVIYARDKRRCLALPALLRRRHRVVLETHELDSALAAEAGGDPSPELEVERAVLALADGLVANCGGTLEAWRAAHGDALPAVAEVVHNGTAPSRAAGDGPPRRIARCVGSMRQAKGVQIVVDAAARTALPVEWVGGTDTERAEIGARPQVAALVAAGKLRLSPPVPYPQVPDLLAQSAVLVLPLADNLFGRALTSPLKLWDYLAATAPIVAPDLPSVREIRDQFAPADAVRLYPPGDAAALAAAIDAARGPRARMLRSWQDRAAEVEAVLQTIVGAP